MASLVLQTINPLDQLVQYYIKFRIQNARTVGKKSKERGKRKGKIARIVKKRRDEERRERVEKEMLKKDLRKKMKKEKVALKRKEKMEKKMKERKKE